MSRNAIIEIDAINTALSIDIRDFSSVLFISKNFDIKTTDNKPVAITKVSDLAEYTVPDDAVENVVLRGYFGADPKPDMIWVYGESGGTYKGILEGLDTRWANNWFYTLSNFVSSEEALEIADTLKGMSNIYIPVLQGTQNLTVEDNLNIPSTIKYQNIHYTASDVLEGQSACLIATVRKFFPGSIPWAAIKLSGITGSKYSLTERITLVGSACESSTGVNIVTEEDRIVIPYYGKSTDGTTWIDYAAAKVAIDEYMRVGLTKYIVSRNTSGNKIDADATGQLQLIMEGTRILDEFADRKIIFGRNQVDEDGNPLFKVKIVSVANRQAEIEYICTFRGAIIKSKTQVSLESIGGN